MTKLDHDSQVRGRAFALLAELADRHGDVLPWKALSDGFPYGGKRVPLLGPQGIFKPQVLDLPLSITTSPSSPYDDRFSPDGFLSYKYRGTNPKHPDNVGLRELMRLGRPLVYFHGVLKGKYVAAWPVYVVGDAPAELTFNVAVDDRDRLSMSLSDSVEDEEAMIRRRYVSALTRVRLHQRTFRARVLAAYREQCALCCLRHAELLEAAHITPDAAPGGEPQITNGLALCKLHHAAFDKNVMGIRPDYVVEIREDVLEEIDGPMLRHGLQDMHGARIYVPSRPDWKPDRDALELRYEQFRAGGH